MSTTGPINYPANAGNTYPVGPVAVADQLTSVLPFPAGSAGVVACDVVNLSGLSLLVSAGSAPGMWIMPGGQITLPIAGQPAQVFAQALAGGAVAGQIVGTYMDADALAGYSSAPGQLAVVNSSGTVSVSGPVTIAGTVPVQIFTSQAQVVATILPQAAGNLNVNVPPWANSIGFLFNNNTPIPLTTGNILATGTATGNSYFSGFGIAQLTYVSPIKFDISPTIDSVLTVFWVAPLQLPLTVVAYAEGSGINTPSTALVTAATDPSPKQAHAVTTVATVNGVSATVLPAVTGGYVYEIIHLDQGWNGVATAAGSYFWTAVTSAPRLGEGFVASGANPGNAQLALAGPFYTPGPIQAFSNFGPAGTATAISRQVPLAASLA